MDVMPREVEQHDEILTVPASVNLNSKFYFFPSFFHRNYFKFHFTNY